MHRCGSAVLHTSPFIVGRVTPLHQRRPRELALLQQQHRGYEVEFCKQCWLTGQQQADMAEPKLSKNAAYVYRAAVTAFSQRQTEPDECTGRCAGLSLKEV